MQTLPRSRLRSVQCDASNDVVSHGKSSQSSDLPKPNGSLESRTTIGIDIDENVDSSEKAEARSATASVWNRTKHFFRTDSE